ncbi:cupin domain-containing protein [Gracilibacillus sp. HCP3S3_G5_1]|uniref:cupin domain-containing protein n=1 Tax=unclassified Gracilibacillus TaxID=2625209 RepID=UPI003F89D8CF
MADETKVLKGEQMTWEPMSDHLHLFHKEILSAEKADELGVHASSILWEKIDVGGQVLPHFHDVVEIIHITTGKVKLLQNGNWQSYQAGDTFQVPAGVIHSVANDGQEPSEQISIFLPVTEPPVANSFFSTTLVDEE